MTTEQASPASGTLTRKNSTFSLRSIFRSSKRNRSKESVDNVSTKSEKDSDKISVESKQELMMCKS